MLPLHQIILKLVINFIITNERLPNFQNEFKKLKLKKITLVNFDFPEGTNVFINERLYSYYNMPWNKCKKLWGKKLIYGYLTSN